MTFVVLASEETVQRSVMDRLIETGRCCRMEMHVEKMKVMRGAGEPSLIQIMVDQKQLENVDYFKCFGSMVTTDAKCTSEIKSRIDMAKAGFNNKKTGLKFENKLVKCYIWSLDLYGAETWTLQKED
jgi:hypothetical protein